MIGIVIVSHSAKLAEGLVDLASAMGGEGLRIQAAGGLDLPGQPLGTDPMRILNAIEAAYSEDGVLVLMDLGSAVLSAEMALDFLPEAKRQHVRLCEAPLVEGTVIAAVQARLGSPLDQVADEARKALVAKASQLHASDQTNGPAQVETARAATPGPIALRLKVANALGLHARPAARLVQTAARFPGADLHIIDLTNGLGPASARSINAIATLGVLRGHEIQVSATGPESQAALAAIQALADQAFGDAEPPEAVSAPAAPTALSPDILAHPASLQGAPASPGIATGPAALYQVTLPAIPAHVIADPAAEWASFQECLEKTRAQIMADLTLLQSHNAAKAGDILEAHRLYLEDAALLDPVRDAIFNQKMNAAAAWQQAVEKLAQSYLALPDAYQRTRAKDVEDVGQQVLARWLGEPDTAPPLSRPAILIAPDLSPAEIARLDPSLVLGIATESGGSSSHAVILARSMGIPAITGLGPGLRQVQDGMTVLMDGASGEFWIEPSQALLAEVTEQGAREKDARAAAQAQSHLPAITRDQRQVRVMANIGSVKDVALALSSGAEGVGVFRTEFLFLQRQAPPSEEEQYQAYRAVAEALGGRPVIIRTLDAGGDKPLPYLNLEKEANPYLGWRAIRLCLAQPEMFKSQLRAILRVAVEFPVKVMFPMVALFSEWQAARRLLQEASLELRERGQAVPAAVETGIMVEIPSAALTAEQFAPEVDFFSIGTNDLTQYTLAAERGNPRLASLYDPFHPAVLELIQRVVQAAHARGKWASVCGEMAGDLRATSLLVGLGVDELSMNAPSIPQVKQIIRGLDYASARVQANREHSTSH